MKAQAQIAPTYFGIPVRAVFAAIVGLIILFFARGVAAQDECRCFHYDGETQAGTTAFDMQFTNQCGKEVTVYYWRQVGKDQDGKRGIVWAKPGTHTDRCNGTREWICTPIVNMEFICPQQGSPPPVTKGTSGVPAGRAADPRALQEAKQKADEARAKAREAAAKAAQKRNEEEAEKKRVKEATLKVPSFCQGMIRTCEERAASLANLSGGTQSQCRAYCQTLQIENCNPSSTVQQAAQACTAGAERDQKEAARQEKLRRQAEAERRQAEAARRERENYIPAGWIRCPCPNPEDDMYLIPLGRAKLVNGVLYHPRDVGPCGGR